MNRTACRVQSVHDRDLCVSLLLPSHAAEERQTLLAGEVARESEDERPPAPLPPQLPPQVG